jgi:hypothetical protein
LTTLAADRHRLNRFARHGHYKFGNITNRSDFSFSCISKSPSIRHLKRRILPGMTKLLDQALQVARNLPSDAQDEIARVVLQLAGVDDAPPVALSTDERAAIAASKEAAARGEFATDAQVRAIWAKHGL